MKKFQMPTKFRVGDYLKVENLERAIGSATMQIIAIKDEKYIFKMSRGTGAFAKISMEECSGIGLVDTRITIKKIREGF